MSCDTHDFVRWDARTYSCVWSVKPHHGDDRVLYHRFDNGSIMLAVSDGASGCGKGYLASEHIINTLYNIKETPTPDELPWFIKSMDRDIKKKHPYSDATLVVVVIQGNRYFYTSVGDSILWKYCNSLRSLYCLTQNQIRKPRIGSSCREPSVHASGELNPHDMLILSSDGITHTLNHLDITDNWIKQGAHADTIQSKIEPFVQNNGLPDDCAVMVYKHHE